MVISRESEWENYSLEQCMVAVVPKGNNRLELIHYLEAFGLQIEDLIGKSILDVASSVYCKFARLVEAEFPGTTVDCVDAKFVGNGSEYRDLRGQQFTGFLSSLPCESGQYDLVVSRFGLPAYLIGKDAVTTAIGEAIRVARVGASIRLQPFQYLEPRENQGKTTDEWVKSFKEALFYAYYKSTEYRFETTDETLNKWLRRVDDEETLKSLFTEFPNVEVLLHEFKSSSSFKKNENSYDYSGKYIAAIEVTAA